jgi:hypothetical protein
MGLFGKKKNEAADNYANVMARMYAPQIPETQDEWLLNNQINFPADSVFKKAQFSYADAWFNVEVAAMMVSTSIPVQCEACEDLKKCSKCGRRLSWLDSCKRFRAGFQNACGRILRIF